MASTNYRDTYARSLEQREDFWLEASKAVSWTKPPVAALDDSAAPLYRWFPEATLNTAYNALDRHVEAGRGDQAALIYDSAMLGIKRSYTYSELTGLVARFAGVLRSQGVGKGRPGGHLHAHDSRSRDCHARDGTVGGSPFGGVRRVRTQGAGSPDR